MDPNPSSPLELCSIPQKRRKKRTVKETDIDLLSSNPIKSKRRRTRIQRSKSKHRKKSKSNKCKSIKKESVKEHANDPQFTIGILDDTDSDNMMINEQTSNQQHPSNDILFWHTKSDLESGFIFTENQSVNQIAENDNDENEIKEIDKAEISNSNNLRHEINDSFEESSLTQDFSNIGFYDEIRGDQNIISLEQAIKDSDYPEFELSQSDIELHYQLLSSDVYVYKIDDDWIVFHEWNKEKNTFSEDTIINVTGVNGKWSCGKKCTDWMTKAYSNNIDVNEAKTPLCIHAMLAHLISEYDNPTNIGFTVKGQDKWSSNPDIYYIKDVEHGNKRWLFVCNRLGVRHSLWLNDTGALKCGKHQHSSRGSDDKGGCLCTKELDEAIKNRLAEEQYKIMRGKGQYQRQPQLNCGTFNRDLLYSKETVPVPEQLLTLYDKNANSAKSKKYYEYKQPDTPPKKLRPEVQECCSENCSATKEERTVFTKTARLYDVHRSTPVEIEWWRCKCGSEYHFDGLYFHLFNYHDEVIWTHDLPLDIAQYISTGRNKTFHGYREQINARYKMRNKDAEPFMLKQKMSDIWRVCIFKFEWFLRLGCRMCDPDEKNEYKVLLMDGTYIIFNKKYAHRLITPRTTSSCHDKMVNIKYLKSGNRFINNKCKPERKILERQIVIAFGPRKIDTKKLSKPLNIGEKNKINAFLNKSENKSIKDFMKWVFHLKRSSDTDETDKLLYYLKPMLRHCFGPVNILQWIHPKLIDICIKFDQLQWSTSQHLFFVEYNPLFANIIQCMIQKYSSIQGMPSQFVNFIKSLAERASEVRGEYRNNRYGNSNPTLSDVPASEEDVERFMDYRKSGSDFFGPLKRYRLNYSIDKKRNVYDDTRCHKDYVTKNKMTSAMVIARCPHSMGLSAHVCADGESVDDIISACTCTMETAPRYIIYDNGCKLSDSARLREYDYWEDTTFTGDEPHANGHKCGEAYNVFHHKHSCGMLKDINCGACEQGNNLLLSFRLSGSFSSMELLMEVLRITLELNNRRIYREKGKVPAPIN